MGQENMRTNPAMVVVAKDGLRCMDSTIHILGSPGLNPENLGNIK